MNSKIASYSERRRWLVLAVTVAAQFMVIVDVAVGEVQPGEQDQLVAGLDAV